MNLNHLHLHVRDRAAAEAFYGRWFGLGVGRRGACLSFLRDDAGFDLALMDDAAPAPMPAWFHLGFRLGDADSVLTLHRRMRDGGVEIVKPLYQDDTLVSYRCADLDGHAIEVYWEAPDAALD
ncbi:MAG TPA: VOC family protein [Ideonella sp.]|uniref:VOC family protein n=1 Tax=Ideonella sp. TaxID=1929293 RepID=UPI002E36EDB5|nr:VOC family protein [Ideonella sp.]HEX5685502.1 VOC family protein [Ideonella sp.]